MAKTTGFVECEALPKHPRFQDYSLDEIKQVCAKNDKQRFCIRQHPNNPNKLQIRANQGHSIETVEVELRKITDPNEIPHEVIHGTYKKFLDGNYKIRWTQQDEKKSYTFCERFTWRFRSDIGYATKC